MRLASRRARTKDLSSCSCDRPLWPLETPHPARGGQVCCKHVAPWGVWSLRGECRSEFDSDCGCPLLLSQPHLPPTAPSPLSYLPLTSLPPPLPFPPHHPPDYQGNLCTAIRLHRVPGQNLAQWKTALRIKQNILLPPKKLYMFYPGLPNITFRGDGMF